MVTSENNRNAFSALARSILRDGAVKATKFLSEKFVIKATRCGKVDKRYKIISILFTIGAPNYRERKYIRVLKEAREPFPVRRIIEKRPK